MNSCDNYFLPPAPDGKQPILHVRGGWSVEVDSMIFDQGIDHLRIEWWDSEDLNPLRKHAALLKKLWIECEVSDVTAVNECVNLVDLGLMRSRSKIDFKRLKHLLTLSLSGQAICSEVAACSNLRTLTVTGASNTNLKALAEASGLRQLCVRESKLTTVEGIERLSKLQSLTLSQLPLQSLDGLDKLDALCDLSLCYLRKLVTLDPISRIHALKKLDITSCGKIENMSAIGGLKTLRELIMENMEIADIGFLAPLKLLERLFLTEGTRVNNGDLSVLLALPKLKDVIFSNRRHYSHKLEGIRQVIEERCR
jgi:Leucine-rich repeat (LRR) protein